ncbi:MAG TPA: hypothetical protein VFS09_06640 [Candidatus Eisenbacteria bacterium]|nr:hypothetical protein [Candidatus Eisenbacteria bacterium]
MIDTSRTGWGVLLLACVVGMILSGASRARAASRHEARVLWVRETHVYLAAPDSGAPEEGARLRFEERGKRIAEGEVTRVVDSALVVAIVTSGSLRSVKKLDRLRVAIDAPLVLPLPLLRIGFPAPGRMKAAMPCDRTRLVPPSPSGLYREEVAGERSWRLVRDSSVVVDRPWPDTLAIRIFEEATDEEIALERGDVDAALFRTGEPSRYILDRVGGGIPLLERGALLAWPGLRRYLLALGPDSIAALLACDPPSRAP